MEDKKSDLTRGSGKVLGNSGEEVPETDGRIGIKYSALQGNYWVLYCCTFSYVTVYLSAKGFGSSSIGVLVAVSNIVGVILQPLFASLVDKGGRFTLKNMMLGTAAFGVIPALLLVLMPDAAGVIVVMFLIEMAIVSILQPLVTAVSGYYQSRGYHMNFGLSRGIGSLTYAAFSPILGYLVAGIGEDMIPAAVGLFMITMVGLNLSLPMKREENTTEEKTESGTAAYDGNLLRKYKTFFLLLFGIMLMFTFHYIVNTYLIQILQQFGGTSADMGFSLSLAAFCEMPAMFLFAYMVRKIRANQMIRIAALGFLLKAIAVWMAGSVMMIHVSQMLQAVSFAVLIPASVYYSDEIMDAQDRVKGQAFITAAITIGGVVGNLLGGVLIDWKGVPAMLTVGLVFAVVGLVFMWIGAVPPRRREIADKKDGRMKRL